MNIKLIAISALILSAIALGITVYPYMPKTKTTENSKVYLNAYLECTSGNSKTFGATYNYTVNIDVNVTLYRCVLDINTNVWNNTETATTENLIISLGTLSSKTSYPLESFYIYKSQVVQILYGQTNITAYGYLTP